MRLVASALLFAAGASPAVALEKPDVTYPIFQFPADRIPRIDGDGADWSLVPESYVIGTDQLWDDSRKHPAPDPKTLSVRVRVGWVKGLNRLYFLYEAWDDYWDFSLPGLHNDTFEVVIDGDASGGPLIDRGNQRFWTAARVGEAAASEDHRLSPAAGHRALQGVHAQNYHVFTPAVDKDWAMAWNAATWTKEFPWANAVSRFDFKPGESGRLVLEFWITPFDYAGPEGPRRAVESVLAENNIVGLAWAIIDYDKVDAKGSHGFWNLSPKHTMYGHASELCAFRLMPLEPSLRPALAAQWSWHLLDPDRRLVAFKDLSVGDITGWRWDFGDGTTSTEQHPQHVYEKPGDYVVVLDIAGPAGTARRSKVWDLQFR